MAEEPTAALSAPGPGWHMLWPTGGIASLQLDVVGFLAILGEDAVKKTSRIASLSRAFLLPRIIPAPHSLLYSERPEELDLFRASVASVYTGNTREHLSHIGGVLFGPMPVFTVRCVEITQRSGPAAAPAVLSASWRGPVVLANLFGCALSILLLILSLVFGDGMSLLATLLLSAVSAFVGITNRWQLRLPKKSADTPPAGDVVIRWPNASFLIVRCTEDVARGLFFSPEGVDYYLNWTNGFIMLSLLGTLFLMISVVALANAKIQLQIAWAGSYILINIAHWVAAALPRRLNWDFSTYELTEQGIDGGPFNKSFTEALWKAILLTKNTRWIRSSKSAPQTPVWDEWLMEAEEVAKRYHSRTATLNEPMWLGKGRTGVAWDVPKDWDPRKEFRRIEEDHARSQATV